jgi:hypothetical protein
MPIPMAKNTLHEVKYDKRERAEVFGFQMGPVK